MKLDIFQTGVFTCKVVVLLNKATCFFDVLIAITIVVAQAWFSYVRKVLDDQGFYFSPTVPEFTDVSDNHQKSVLDSPDTEFGGKWKACQKLKFVHICVIGRLEPNNLESW